MPRSRLLDGLVSARLWCDNFHQVANLQAAGAAVDHQAAVVLEAAWLKQRRIQRIAATRFDRIVYRYQRDAWESSLARFVASVCPMFALRARSCKARDCSAGEGNPDLIYTMMLIL